MSINTQLLTVLEKSVGGEKNELEAAQHFLEQAASSDFVELLKQLSNILHSTECSTVSRMQAGLQLKNALYSKDKTLRLTYHQRWLQIPQDARNQIKNNCLTAIGTEGTLHSSAAQCVAYIACVEFPVMQWPDLMEQLVQNVTNPESSENCKHGTLEAIGYICQDINERNYIMQVICEATQSDNIQIRVAALQCLVKIMSLYYQYMETYMGQALFAITLDAMKDPTPDVSLQGIEFWSTVCDEEIELAIDEADSSENGQPPQVSSMYYAKGALKFVIPILMEILTKQHESTDDDEWNPCKAAGVCLMLMAQCCEDHIVPLVIPFVTQHIQNQDWRYRDAAVMCFGSILEGPDPTALKSFVTSAMPCIIGLLQDGSPAVRDTSAWTIGRVCETLPEIALQDTYLVHLLNGLVSGLSAEPRIAANVCWAFSSLAESAYDVALNLHGEQNGDPHTYALSEYFNAITEQLLSTTLRPDGNQHNLRNAAYSSLMALIRSAARDCYSHVQRVTLIVLERLESILNTEIPPVGQDRSQFDDLQSLLCGTLQSVLRKISKEDAPLISDKIMTALMLMFQSTSKAIARAAGDQAVLNGESSKSADGVQEDALLAVSALIDLIGDGFLKYLDAFLPILIYCLRDYNEIEVCNNAIGLLGDMCRVLNKHLLPHCDSLLAILMQVLQSATASKSIQSAILSTFGDFALALGPDFFPYLPHVLNTLKLATEVDANEADPDVAEYLNTLRTSCLEAYTGIIQGLKNELQRNQEILNFLGANIPDVLSFIGRVSATKTASEELVAASCGLIGDIVSSFGATVLPLVEMGSISNVLQKGRRAKLSKTKNVAVWATKEIRKLKYTAGSSSSDQGVPIRSGLNASTAQPI